MIGIVHQIFSRLRGGNLFNPEGRRANSIFNRQEKNFTITCKKFASHPRRATLKITILSRPRTRLRQTTTTSTTEASLEVCDEGDRYLMKSNFITTLRWRRIWLRRGETDWETGSSSQRFPKTETKAAVSSSKSSETSPPGQRGEGT